MTCASAFVRENGRGLPHMGGAVGGITCYAQVDEGLVVEGGLRDQRLMPAFSAARQGGILGRRGAYGTRVAGGCREAGRADQDALAA